MVVVVVCCEYQQDVLLMTEISTVISHAEASNLNSADFLTAEYMSMAYYQDKRLSAVIRL